MNIYSYIWDTWRYYFYHVNNGVLWGVLNTVRYILFPGHIRDVDIRNIINMCGRRSGMIYYATNNWKYTLYMINTEHLFLWGEQLLLWAFLIHYSIQIRQSKTLTLFRMFLFYFILCNVCVSVCLEGGLNRNPIQNLNYQLERYEIYLDCKIPWNTIKQWRTLR